MPSHAETAAVVFTGQPDMRVFCRGSQGGTLETGKRQVKEEILLGGGFGLPPCVGGFRGDFLALGQLISHLSSSRLEPPNAYPYTAKLLSFRKSSLRRDNDEKL